jgi:hypothetical protein
MPVRRLPTLVKVRRRRRRRRRKEGGRGGVETHGEQGLQAELGAVLTSKAEELTATGLVVHATKALVPSMEDKVVVTIVSSEIGTLGEQIDDLVERVESRKPE